jgi:hypothetical protein
MSVSLMRLKTLVKTVVAKERLILDQLRVGVAGGLDRGEVGVADGAAGFGERADEADERIALGIAGQFTVAICLSSSGLSPASLPSRLCAATQ